VYGFIIYYINALAQIIIAGYKDAWYYAQDQRGKEPVFLQLQ
jgi:hypothetical protein